MHKHPKIKYNFSGNEEDVNHLIRQFSTDKILMAINKESNKILFEEREIPGVERVEYSAYNSKTKSIQKLTAIIQSWNLIDLAYYAILWSNDHRGKNIEYDNEFYALVVAADNFNEKKMEPLLDSLISNSPEVMLHFWGFGGEQFKLEIPKKAFDNAERELYIIFESGKLLKGHLDLENIIKQDVGVEWEKIVVSLIILWTNFTRVNTLQEIISQLNFQNSQSKAEFLKVVEKYTVTYADVRNSTIGRQILYTKPFVKTQKGEIVSISPYLNLFAYEHGIFWILRNYFKKQNKNQQEFTNYFGFCFEEYFQEVLANLLNEGEFCKIKEEKRKRADWKIDIENYHFLIEQKSAVMLISAKQQMTDVDAIKKYASKTIFEALVQLQQTEEDLGKGKEKYIKIILLYEDYLQPEALDSIFRLEGCSVNNDDYYWLVNIEEMEKLLWLRNSDFGLFRKIVNEKIRREITHSINGKGILQLIEENGIKGNEYLRTGKRAEYRNIIKNNINKIVK